ncbi:MAG: 1,6-anhydro-N-acetylmuramyl-L-alanine amidase AmpD [Sinobacteraceae bacterium]|nr:1,6-anhydro-N-acetylmuramyl-L-alanine amidase AmpD [Nevskiaceae bacterium]
MAQMNMLDRGDAPRVPRFAVDRDSGRLAPALWTPSCHADERPDGSDISLLVVHAISLPPCEFGGPWIDDLFLGRLDCAAHPEFEKLRGLRVSAHLCIFRDGRVRQYVAFDRRAWHAGESSYAGRARCNDFSIGVELEGCDQRPFEDVQYATLAGVARALMRAYPGITAQRIAGHSEIAPGRKTDPGPFFDWARLRKLLECAA